MFQIGGHVSDPFEPLLYFARICEASAHAPPNPCNPVREREAICKFCEHNRISVGVEKAKRKRQPLPAGGYCQDVQQKDEQIVRVPRFR
jgi:hypothetical protein